MLSYLLKYMEDYLINYLKEQFVEEVLELLELKKQQVIHKIEEKLKEDSDLDVYSELTENLDYYI